MKTLLLAAAIAISGFGFVAAHAETMRDTMHDTMPAATMHDTRQSNDGMAMRTGTPDWIRNAYATNGG
jgi:hypothetical protein